MKQLFTLLIVTLMTLPSIGQQARNSQSIPTENQRQMHAKAPGRHGIIRSATAGSQASQFSRQQARHEKNALAQMQQLDNIVYQAYDNNMSQWIDHSKDEFIYDAAGNNTAYYFSYWNPETSLYLPDSRWIYGYENDNMVELVMSYWDSNLNLWAPGNRTTFDYNANGYISLRQEYSWDGSVWQVMAKYENTYDASWNLTLQVYYSWDENTTEWLLMSKKEISYNADGTMAVSTEYGWDMENSLWFISYKVVYTYNAQGQQLTFTALLWNMDTSEWVNEYKEEYTYDGNMNVTLVMEAEWVGGEWSDTYKNELTFNNTYAFNELILPYDYLNQTDLFNHMVTEVLEYYFVGNSFLLAGRSLADYSQVNITGIVENEIRQANIYPQPANDRVTFRWENNTARLDLAVYDINGRQVLTQQLESNATISVDRLAPGLYFYKLTGSSQTVYSGKMSIR